LEGTKDVADLAYGTAEKYAGLDVANPGSLILSGAMMFDYIGWSEAAKTIEGAMEKTFRQGVMTQDLARQTEGVRAVKTSGFADAPHIEYGTPMKNAPTGGRIFGKFVLY